MKCSADKAKRMLLVDDTDAVRRVLEDMFRIEAGFDVETAASGVVALDMLSKNNYDVLLVDLGMPVMSGTELYQCIKDKYPDVADRVIFMSGGIQGAATELFLEQTNRPFLLKPFTVDALMKLV